MATPRVVLEMPLLVGAAGPDDVLWVAVLVAVELVVALEGVAEVVEDAVETMPEISLPALPPSIVK